MFRSGEWHLSLGPLGFSIGTRTIRLEDALPAGDGATPESGAASRLPPDDPRAVGRVRFVDPGVEASESEGGGPGRGEGEPPSGWRG